MGGLATSYVSGTSAVPLLGETIGAHFDRTVARWGDRPGLIVRQQGMRWTWRELGEPRRRASPPGCWRSGCEPGERIGIWSPNNAEWVLTQFATAKAGLILVNINPAYRLTELEYALNKVGCRALVTATAFKTSDYVGMLTQLAPGTGACGAGRAAGGAAADAGTGDPDRRAARIPGALAFDDIAGARRRRRERARLAELGRTLQFDDPINIQFTSGTTGSPKGATLTHHNILNNGFFVGEAMRLTEQDRLCIPVPLYHCFGMVMGNLACLTHGAAMVYPGEGFDPLATLQTVAEERCTALYGVPTMFIAAARPSGVRALRPVVAAHRHHGRRALPDRGDAPLHRARCTCARSPSPTA